MIKIWKPIYGYEGWYEVSNSAEIRSLDRVTTSRSAKGRILKQAKQNCGYNIVSLHKNGNYKNHLVHRVVAAAFVPNPNSYQFVNHKNGIKTDNRLENLEWCTKSQNAIHAYQTGLKKVTQKHLDRLINWNKTEHGVKVTQYLKTGEKIASFISMAEASKKTKLNYNAIVDCVRGRHKTCGGFIFKQTEGSF